MMISMRDAFINRVFEIAKNDRQVLFLSNDFGAPSLDKFREQLHDQFIHTGISEQNMVNVAAGLSMAGKHVYIYSIAPFLPLRCLEQIRVHMAYKKLKITAVMVGAGFSYDLSGPTHQALEDISIVNSLPNITIYNVSDPKMAEAVADFSYNSSAPMYLRFDREKLPNIHKDNQTFSEGLTTLTEVENIDIHIISTGIMVHRAIEVAQILAQDSINVNVIDLYRIKPLNKSLLIHILGTNTKILTIEENFLNSGIFNIISQFCSVLSNNFRIKSIGIPDQFIVTGGNREYLQSICGLDKENIVNFIKDWLNNE